MVTVRKVFKEIEIIEKYYDPTDNSQKENSFANLVVDLQKLIKYAKDNKNNRKLTKNWCCYECGMSYRAFMHRYNRWVDYENDKVVLRALFDHWEDCIDYNRQKAKFDTNEIKIVDSITANDPISYSFGEQASITFPQGIVIHVPK